MLSVAGRKVKPRIPSKLFGKDGIRLVRNSQHRFMGTVRVIARQDWENGKAYVDDVLDVRAGYARNYLIPQKLAVYATRENFLRYNVPNPDQETAEQRKERLEREASAEDIDLKAHDLLRKYLRNKTLKIWRHVEKDAAASGGQEDNRISPGMVDVKALRDKLSKQLKIDLERHETIHIHPEPVVLGDLSEPALDSIVEAIDTSKDETLEIRHLGEYVARISLRGDYWVPLKFTILPR